jgi:nitroreductase
MMDIGSLMKKRRSAREYLPTQVKRADIEEIISCAGAAPSAINVQPWEYVVVYGDEKDRLARRLLKVQSERKVNCGPGTSTPLPDEHARRSREASAAMKPVTEKMGLPMNQFVEEGSCAFYGAPVAIIVTIDQVFPKLRYLDIGLSVSYLLLAAEAKGLSTCPIGLVTAYGDEIRDALSIPEGKEVLLVIALGYADERAPINNLKTHRTELSEILTWYE